MEKIKLTQEQADVIESLKEDSKSFFGIARKQLDGWSTKRYRCLNELLMEDFCKAMLIPDGYEVIPQYKVGDWVRHDDGEIGKITKIEDSSGQIQIFTDIKDIKRMYSWEEKYICDPVRFFRHATPEEIQQEKKRRFWDRIDRKEDDYRVGDFVVDLECDYAFVVELDANLNWVFIEYIKTSYGKKYIPKSDLLLVTPVEQRLDT